jgi:hypothetical protein
MYTASPSTVEWMIGAPYNMYVSRDALEFVTDI